MMGYNINNELGSTDNNSQLSCLKMMNRSAKNLCSLKTLKKRLPIIEWLPKYNMTFFLQDIIAGITVGLTAIPQSIAYAIIAGLEPQYGLYSAFFGAYVYLFFGSCKDVTIGPTAILSAMVAKYVKDYGVDFAILATFLSGCVTLLLGILHLGFLVDFISNPVINGFTTAAALQIAAAQLKNFFAIKGSSGNTFFESLYNFFKNITTMRAWDSLLSIATVVMLILLKLLGKYSSRTNIPGYSIGKNLLWKLNWFTCMSRNAVVVVIGIILAYCFKIYLSAEPFNLTGHIIGGLPTFKPPPFSTVVGNTTYTFTDMLSTYGPQAVVLPFISILESIAIAKAFARGKTLDATQEMIALGLCNILSSFIRSMPITGSFTRTAVNYASGVQTQAGGIFKGLVVIMALSLLTSTFYFIPKASLAALIITAMYYMVDFRTIVTLWRGNKCDLAILLIAMISSLGFGLEYGICAGVLCDSCILMYRNYRVDEQMHFSKMGEFEVAIVQPKGHILYCAAENFMKRIRKIEGIINILVIDGSQLNYMDSTVAKNLTTLISDFKKDNRYVVLWNFPNTIRVMFEAIAPEVSRIFFTGTILEDAIRDLTLPITNSAIMIP